MQVAVNGLATGLLIAVLALAFTVVHLPTRVFHIALAGIYVLGPYVAMTFIGHSVPWPLALVAALGMGALLSATCEWLNHARLEKRGASTGTHLVASLGLFIIIVQAIVTIWGGEPKVLRLGQDKVVRAGGLMLTRAQLVAVGVSALLLAAFHVWLRRSDLGLRFRALADNPQEMALRGYDVRWLRLLAFGISGFLASAASLCTAFDLGFEPHSGLPTLLLAVVAMIIGGRSSFVGPLVGGLLLGLIRSEVVWYLSARWQEAVTFFLLAAFLLLRPQGLLGQKARLEAAA
jgi:branched-chain amino acid transport system permease protein